MDTAGHLCLVGNGENRWYDKIVQYIVFKNGRGGLNGEHTCVIRTATYLRIHLARVSHLSPMGVPLHRPIDAPTAGAMTDHMLRYLRKAQESSLPSEEQSVASDLRAPTKLQWTLSPSLRAAQEQCVAFFHIIDFISSATETKYITPLLWWLQGSGKLRQDGPGCGFPAAPFPHLRCRMDQGEGQAQPGLVRADGPPAGLLQALPYRYAPSQPRLGVQTFPKCRAE